MSQGMTRREFIKKGLTMVAVGATAPSFITRTALAMNNPWDVAQVTSRPGVPDDRVLVVVQMGGGNDGLNTLVPFTNDAYYRARPNLAVAQKDVIRVTDELGLHPNLAKVRDLYDKGAMAVVQGVGYPNPSRSHFKSMEIWHTADPEGRVVRVGWIGRYFDSKCPVCEQPTVGVNIGEAMPLAMSAETGMGVSLENPETFQWMPTFNGLGEKEEQELFKLLNAPALGVNEPGTIDFLRHTAMNAYVSSERVRAAANGYRGGIEYANNRFAYSMRLIAQMIAGKLPTKVYYAHMTGFDTHANQRGTSREPARATRRRGCRFLQGSRGPGERGPRRRAGLLRVRPARRGERVRWHRPRYRRPDVCLRPWDQGRTVWIPAEPDRPY